MSTHQYQPTSSFTTEQEEFWAGEFGDDYLKRNTGNRLINTNVILFSEVLKSASNVKSILELGCNIGLNLEALKQINPDFELTAYEINANAAAIAEQKNVARIINGTILDPLDRTQTYDLTFTKGVLIHINPDFLEKVYENLYALSNRYIMICEYYNPTPVEVTYRGSADRLFKRDFAGDLIRKYDLRLVSYGFKYHGDNVAPQDDTTWFLLEKA
jgi:pseudaminic acid biosynthesis-associated methylase